MRKSAFFLATLTFIFDAIAQRTDDWKSLGLKGRVKSLKVQETHRYKKDGVNFTDWANSHGHFYAFSQKGNKTEYQHFEEDGSLGYKATYVFNPSGKILEESFSNRDGKQTSRTVYQLNEQGKTLEETQYKMDGSLSVKYVFSYDDKGKMLERKGLKPDGSISSTSRWTYDGKGNNTERNDGYFIHRFLYDDQGNKVEEIISKPDNTVSFKLNFKYDEKGNKVEELKYNGKGELKDKNNWRYEYDKTGNWTKRVQTGQSGEDFFIEERTIVYY